MKRIKVFFVLFCLLLYLPLYGQNNSEIIGHREEDICWVYDQEDNYIFAIALAVNVGDKYIDEDNIEYEIIEVGGNKAICKKKGKVDLLADIGPEFTLQIPLAKEGKKTVAIYHTHNDESYLPGPVNIDGVGEIHEVGDALKEALEKKGITVVKSENLHLPHDGAAYERSRGTVADLVQEEPDIIFDLHRDAIPRKDEYLKEINGKTISQIRLVVGRQNPNQKVNDQFARRLKALADEEYPGLIKGIFYGKGVYNQHVAPHSLLLEFGTHVTTKEQAIASAQLFAEPVSKLLFASKGGTGQKENAGIFSSIIWILGVIGIGVLIYLLINEGSIGGVGKRLKAFFRKELK